MIYIVKNCIELIDGEVRAICGGWCCYKLNFSEFPNGRWHSKPCDYLKEGICSCYDDRPTACEGSPFFDGSPILYPVNKFITPWCAYRREVLEYCGAEYEVLETGAACIEQYIKQGLGDFERWTERRFYKEKTLFYSTSRRSD